MLASFLRRVQPIRGARSFSALVVKESHVEVPGANTGSIHTELKGRKALIYQPARNTMQSGTANTENWCLKFDHTGHWYNPLMGYTSTADAVGTLRLYFDTEANAVSYAEKVGLSYAVEKPAPPKKRVVKSFEGNFKWRGPPKKPEDDI